MTARLGREALLDAASVLMDQQGIDNVSLNEINRASGHLNRSAATYHFGSRDAVVQALFTRTMEVVDAERNALLDHLEVTGVPLAPRTIVEVVVGPAARQLRTPEGRRHLRLCGQLIVHPRFFVDTRQTFTLNSSITRCVAYLAPDLEKLPRPIAVERGVVISELIVHALADQARLIDTDPPPRPALPLEAFTANLVDIVLAILEAPTSVNGGSGS